MLLQSVSRCAQGSSNASTLNYNGLITGGHLSSLIMSRVLRHGHEFFDNEKEDCLAGQLTLL